MIDGTCFRCGNFGTVYGFEFKNCDDERSKVKICWDCDWEITNGQEISVNVGDIMMTREENDYEYDPINNPRPY